MPNTESVGASSRASSAGGRLPSSVPLATSRYVSACAAPAISQRRKRAASSWRAPALPSPTTSVSDCTVITGTRTSSRMRSEPASGDADPRPLLTAAARSARGSRRIELPSSAACLPPRPWIRKPSKTRASASTAFTYVTRKIADCDSPIASTRRGARPPSRRPSRAARAHLREDVERERVAGVRERAVAVRIHLLERHRDGREAAALDADLLHRDADPREALAHQVPVREAPVRRCIEAARDVEPLDHHAAVEARRIERAAHDGARAVFRFLRGRGVGARCAGEEVLLVRVAECGEIVGGGLAEEERPGTGPESVAVRTSDFMAVSSRRSGVSHTVRRPAAAPPCGSASGRSWRWAPARLRFRARRDPVRRRVLVRLALRRACCWADPIPLRTQCKS